MSGRIGSDGREGAAVAAKTRAEGRFDRWIERAGAPRSAALVIAYVTISTAIVAALLMKIIDKKEFPSVGSGLWWAIETVTSVGYGDIVPVTAAGRIVASLVMLLGIGFLTVITAAITSSFIAQSRESMPKENNAATEEQFRRIRERLERIEAALTDNT